MNREIEYRAYWKSKGEIRAVVDMYFGKSGDIQSVRLLAEHDGMQYPTDNIAIKDVELMQYTGIKDKNGVKVYEGDVIQQHHFYDVQGVERFLTHIVEWSDKYSGWFALNADSMDESDGSQQLWAYMKSGYETKVIGNIHEDKK